MRRAVSILGLALVAVVWTRVPALAQNVLVVESSDGSTLQGMRFNAATSGIFSVSSEGPTAISSRADFSAFDVIFMECTAVKSGTLAGNALAGNAAFQAAATQGAVALVGMDAATHSTGSPGAAQFLVDATDWVAGGASMGILGECDAFNTWDYLPFPGVSASYTTINVRQDDVTFLTAQKHAIFENTTDGAGPLTLDNWGQTVHFVWNSFGPGGGGYEDDGFEGVLASVSGVAAIVREAGPLCFVIDAIDDQFSVINDGTTADFIVLANDECSDDPPISVVELPGDLLPDRGGSATTDGAKVSYTPAAGFIGFEEFTYTAQDAGLEGGDDPPAVDRDTATVVVNVAEDINPDAVDDVATTLQNQATIIDVLANDSLGNAPSNVEIETAPANGSATVQSDDTIRYVPNFNFFGEDSFEYRLTDANGDSDVATVTVCVFFGSGQVPIDIMPADPGNNVNLRAGPGAGINVAILSVGGLCGAPNVIDPLTLKFGPGQANISASPHVRDVDGDGDDDLVVRFLIQQTGIACGDTQASLSGRTFDAQPISGSDAINTFNCPRVRKRH